MSDFYAAPNGARELLLFYTYKHVAPLGLKLALCSPRKAQWHNHFFCGPKNMGYHSKMTTPRSPTCPQPEHNPCRRLATRLNAECKCKVKNQSRAAFALPLCILHS